MDVFSLSDGARAFYAAACHHAAVELGVFAVWPGEADDNKLAARLGLPPRRLAALLRVLRLEGFDTSPPPAAPVVDEGWGRLAEVIRRDRPLDASAHVGAFHAHLAAAGAEPARALAPRLHQWAPSPSLLDLGGGLGHYAAAFAELGGTAVVVDRAEVLAQAPPHAGVTFSAGDIFAAPSGFGAALLCNVLHLYGAADCARLIAVAARAAAHVVVKDLDPRTPAGAYFAVNMALYTPAGAVHDAADITAWFAAAGLPDAETISFGDHLVVHAGGT